MANMRGSSWKKWVAPIALGVVLVLFSIFLFQPFGKIKTVEAAPYDANTSTVFSYYKSIPSISSARGFLFDPTGTRLAIVDSLSVTINRYTLANPFEVSTSSPAIFINQNSLITWENDPRGLAFNSTGSRMFILGAGNKRIDTFGLSSPYDTSGTSTQFLYWYDVSAQNPSPRNLLFNNDGTKMFVTSVNEAWISTYNLSIPYVVSTSSVSFDHYTSVSAQVTNPISLAFNSDGSKFLVTDFANSRVVTFNLSTPYVIATSSISFDHYYSVSGNTNNPVGLVFNLDGTKMFIDDGTLMSTFTNTAAAVVKSKKQSEFFFD